MLSQQKIMINSQAQRWRFKIRINKFEISNSQIFDEQLNDRQEVFALICVGVVQTHVDKSEQRVSKQLRHFENQFDNAKIDILSEQEEEDHAIDLIEGKESSFMFLYNLSQTELAELRRYIDDALTKDWIRHSVSLADASILFVSKKNDDLRLCVNYRELNSITVKNRHSLPLIIETLDRLSDVKRFTALNLKNVYHRLRIKRSDEWKTAFRTRYDHFEYQIMSFELANAPTIFQVYINKVLRDLVDDICVIYLNDILIYSSESTQHWRHVKLILQRLRDFELYVNLKKCVFDTTQMKFLSFIVFIDEVSMNSEWMRTIEEWSRPRTYRELQMFLRFVNFYRRFVYRYSHIVASLTDLLKDSSQSKKSESFEWPTEVEQAFRRLKQIFTSTPLLQHYDSFKRIRIEIDVFIFGIAGIMTQSNEDEHWRSMAFWSRKLISAKQNYEIHDQELLIIVTVFKQWRHYLESSSHLIEVWFDHNNLRDFMKIKKLNQRQARWALKLAVYDFEIFHRFDSRNSTNESSRRLDYEDVCPLNTRLLFTLQNKLTLTAGDIALSKSRRKKTSLDHTLASVQANAIDASLRPSQSKRKILADLVPVFQLAEIQVIILQKIVADISETVYEKPQRSMKFLIKNLQTENAYVIRLRTNIQSSALNRRSKSKEV